jgi:DnaJ-class molecular chaperone
MDKTRADTEIDCAFCNGTGHDRFGLLSPPSACQVCLGKGVVDVPEPRVSCAFCRGSGVHPHTRLTCGGCGGKGLQTVREARAICPRCRGDGVDPVSEQHLYCSACHGAGWVHTPTPEGTG